ncbi:MAG: YceI family protein [Candidatus Binatia bacterium]
MRRIVRLSGLFVVVWVTFVSTATAETVYTVDTSRSELVVQLFKAGVGAAFAHDHVVHATTFAGQIRLDATTPSNSSVTVEVQTPSLIADEPTTRQRYGLTSTLSEKNRQQIQETMMSTSQLDVGHYPTITFTSTQIGAAAAGIYTVTGNLTIREITQTVTFPAQVEQREQALQVRGSFRFNQSSFGYEPYSAFFGAVRNQDEVRLHFDILAIPKTETLPPERGE